VEAPGVQITSTVPGAGTGTWSGTSMSTPLVAGEAALVRALYPGIATPDVVKRITVSAAPVNSAVRLRVDAAAALGPLILSSLP
jgi:subtilisin family serine protease